MRISPSSAILHLEPGHRPPTDAEGVLLGPVDAAAGGGLGQAVALEDEHAGGVEELGDLARQRRAARDEEADAPAQNRLDLPEHQSGCDAILERQPERNRLVALLVLGDLLARRENAQSKMLLLARRRGVAVAEDAEIDLLEHARHRAHEGRPHLGEVVLDLGDRLGERDARALGDRGPLEDLGEDVRHRQEQELLVASRRRAARRCIESHSHTMFLWVSTTPLGGPVVPEV